MSIKRIFIAISAIFAASAVFADNSSVTSKKYVDDLMSGYQGKLPGSGANKLMIYDDEDGIGEKSIETTLVSNATGVPTVGAVKTGLDGKQDTITGTAGYVMTGTGNPGEVGEKPIYSANTNYTDSLVTAESVNNGVINAVNHSLRRVNANGELDNNGTLWEIADTVVALSYLPAGYTQLEYIRSDGSQYIDTGIVPTLDYEFEIKAVKETSKSLIGSDLAGYTFTGGGSSNYLYMGSSNAKTVLSGVNNSVPHVWAVKNDKLYCDETNVAVTKTQVTPTLSFSLFCRHTGDSAVSDCGHHAIYYAKIWNAIGNLVFNGIPAKDSSNVIGMYDTVSGTFFTNQGQDTFIAGPAVGN